MSDTTSRNNMKNWNETIQLEISTLERNILSHRTKESVQQLCVFDFDGTLVKTPCPEEGKEKYHQYYFQPWPFRSWWSRPESLLPPVISHPLPPELVISSVVSQFRYLDQELTNLCIVLTGRLSTVRPQVLRITQQLDVGILPWRVFCKPESLHWTTDTFTYKQQVLQELARRFGDIRRFIIYEDRLSQVNLFKNVLAPNMQKQFSIDTSLYHVKGEEIINYGTC
ncbi:hypothetical protein Gasu2_32820 [Galdieria sulphuraria]|uniref:Swiss Army Knife RNA repair protein HAD domain-containing protein n=1 Tax=Galdieria sulphuraria TaxID=130081 RepID=M2W4C9_GALSU|nr:uncharacterized protein Gasu_20720 [Galdieria sulphuraria]EME30611.1 hypothetical protein Gasu_20720 [Galdieria sulphuraria]GJD09008.1 hypothetical protein Gasu2_32820 [Galdieria sulphuraria]|eukprot:XP_005707131.1 hypothetical protein Gasu_20720 [Galdieria sulphuraria]